MLAGGTFTSTSLSVASGKPTRITALTDVTVIDVATGRRDRHQTVLISGDRIIGVGRIPVPRGAVEINLSGKYVIPGLADMHVHSLGDERVSPPLYLANGLTTVREMAGTNPLLYDWRDRIEAGTLLGPRMIVGSQIIDGDPTLWDPNLLRVLVVSDEPAARAAVRQVKAEGADFVKVYSRLSRQSYAAILDEAPQTRPDGPRPRSGRAHLEGSQLRAANAASSTSTPSACRCPRGRPRYAGWCARSR